MSALDRIEAFRPSPADDNWRELDAHLRALGPLTLATVAPLLRVFERFPRHDGHGVFWTILHAVEAVEGYAPILVEHVMRTPTEMGIRMLQRMINAGTTHVGVHELAPLVVMLSSRAPILDSTIDLPPRAIDPLLLQLAAFHPPDAWGLDWTPLTAIVDGLLASRDHAIVTPLLQTLDRFHSYEAFPPFWTIVKGLESLPDWPSALLASLRSTPTRNGVTLLLRQLATGVTQVDGVDVAELAAALMPSDAAVQNAPDR